MRETTKTQRLIVFYILCELTNRQISKKTGLKLSKIKSDLQKLYLYYQVKGRVGLIRAVLEEQKERALCKTA